ncbi:MAG: Swt1 family HEPN domain-containing protein [Actinomycetota bacterium]
MALSNRDRVQRGLDLLRAGLIPFVERELKARLGARWQEEVDRARRYEIERAPDGSLHWDNAALLGVMLDHWHDVFSRTLGPPQRTLVHELKGVRNDWAHDKPFSTDQTYRALDSMRLLLEAISASEQAREVERHAAEVLRTKFSEQARAQGRRVESAGGRPDANLPPWREVITPHEDVAAGRYLQAEFMADLAQIHRGEGTDEYRDPHEFFRRTFLTEGLSRLLTDALRRLSGKGGDPVVELQTNFGGGKTHSMLALYHLFSGVPASSLVGVEPLLKAAGVSGAPEARRAVLVGSALSVGQADRKPDGTVVHTLWGEMAWQLGGADGYAMVAEADRTGTSPGSIVLADLFRALSPCLILIDEWVAYLRNLYGHSGLPAGSFDANLTFAQALTEAARAVPGTLVVASLPMSQIEVGGEGGEEALARLKQTFSRVESSWRPASAEEGFEIVRRRLFREDTEKHAARDLVVKRFSEMYRNASGTFPSGCSEAEYARRMTAAYPIHPELFDRLYGDWSSLDKFQRTRGVLRLMAAVIHALWENEDKNLLIMPSTIPMENEAVRFELTRYMDDPWDAVIAKDVDGPGSLPLRLDRENTNLGRYSASRRVARTIYMGSAPTAGAATPGIEEKNIMLGCVQPGETAATFGDALRRLTDGATYLYVDGRRYWYSTQPSVARLARDRAESYDEDEVHAEITHRLRAGSGARNRGDFAGVHVAPESTSEVPDEMEARLVILGPQRPHAAKNPDSQALAAAKEILAQRGQSPRLYKNTLVFLAADARRLRDLEGRVRQFLAWSSIAEEVEALNLTPFAARQAATKRKEAETAVNTQIAEAWTWCLVPEQPEPLGEVEWAEIRATGQDPLAIRASKKLVAEELLLPVLGPARLKMELDRKLWRDTDHIGIRQLWEYLCSYLYLPRLKDRDVLLRAIQEGVSTVAASDLFAYAEAYDEETGRYVGLRLGGTGSVVLDSSSVLVKPEVARRQIEAEEQEARERAARVSSQQPGGDSSPGTQPGITYATGGHGDSRVASPLGPTLPRRFHASVTLDPDRVGRDAGKIADEILSHLIALPGARLNVSLEIDAELPEGAPEDVQRTVSENANVLKFDSHGFERE